MIYGSKGLKRLTVLRVFSLARSPLSSPDFFNHPSPFSLLFFPFYPNKLTIHGSRHLSERITGRGVFVPLIGKLIDRRRSAGDRE